jgi:hypothetical protein
MTLVERSDTNEFDSYRYRLEFPQATLVERFVFDRQNKLASGLVEAVEWKPGATFQESPEERFFGIGVALRLEGKDIVVEGIVADSPAAAQKDLTPVTGLWPSPRTKGRLSRLTAESLSRRLL